MPFSRIIFRKCCGDALRPWRADGLNQPIYRIPFVWSLLAPGCYRRVCGIQISLKFPPDSIPFDPIRPLIGGVFSNAAQKYPKLFGNIVFETFPYLLPCLVVATSIVISVAVGFVYLKEASIFSSNDCKRYLPCEVRLFLRKRDQQYHGITQFLTVSRSTTINCCQRSLPRTPDPCGAFPSFELSVYQDSH